MQFSWVKKHISKKLIVFFNGWSMDENSVQSLASDKYDVLMFFDYSDLKFSQDLKDEINSYDEINVIAWSFGVWTAFYFADKFKNVSSALAINGSGVPIDKKFGIAPRVFDFTLSTLSEESYKSFFENMFSSGTVVSAFPKRSIDSQKYELSQMKKFFKENENLQYKFFDKVIIGIKDKIIPVVNQKQFWAEKTDTQVLLVNKGHYIFDLFSSWDEIVSYE